MYAGPGRTNAFLLVCNLFQLFEVEKLSLADSEKDLKISALETVNQQPFVVRQG